MSKFKIINLIDKIFVSCSVFLIVYAWLNFFIRNLWTTFILSLIFSSAIMYIIYFFLSRKNKNKILSKEYIDNLETSFLSFKLLSNNERNQLLKSILSFKGECKKNKTGITINENGISTQYFVELSKKNLTQFDIVNIVSKREKNITNLKIICEESDINITTKILNNLDVEIINKKELYDKYFLPTNLSPTNPNLITKKEKKKVKEIIKNFFVPRKAKSFFLCGLFLIFSGIILPYHVYYLIFGSIFLLFSIICKLQPHFKR